MTQCTRTRKPGSARLHTPLDDILWSRSQDQQTSYIAAQEAARVRQDRIAGILDSFTFTIDEDTTLYDPDGRFCSQVGMTVVSKTDRRESYLIIAKLLQDREEWTCSFIGANSRYEEGPLVIQAVQTRRDRKRQQRLEAKQAQAA